MEAKGPVPSSEKHAVRVSIQALRDAKLSGHQGLPGQRKGLSHFYWIKYKERVRRIC